MENTATATNNAGGKYNPQEYIDLADKSYLSCIKEGRYKDIINSMSNLGDYSLRNQMLILQQYPNATKVNSMSGWNFNKRSVMKGSQSIKILAPVFDSVVTTENGKIVEKKSDYVSGFRINFVFDVSQTESKELDQAQTGTENYEDHYGAVSKALMETLKSYEFKFAEIGSDGVLDTRCRTVTIKQGLSEKQTLKTLVDQVAAALILGRDRNKFQGLKDDAVSDITAIEISAVSDIVSRRLGLGGRELQEPTFAEMSDSDLEKFANNIGVMRSVSQLMIKAVENAMTEIQTQKELAEAQAVAQQNASEAPFAMESEQQADPAETVKTTRKTRVKAEAEMTK